MSDSPKLRSKDEAHMDKLKKATYSGLLDATPSEKRSAWRLLKRRVFMEDIQKLAIYKLQAKTPVYIGSGSLSPDLVVITSISLDTSKEAANLVKSMVAAMKVDNVFYTSKYKTTAPLQHEVATHEEILQMELKTVKPKGILVFGNLFGIATHQVDSYMDIPIIQTDQLKSLLSDSTSEEEKKEVKARIWNDMKQIRNIIES